MSILKNGALIALLAAFGFGLTACESTMNGSDDSMQTSDSMQTTGEAVADEPQPQ